MRAAVYVTAGLGDAILLSPAVAELKKKYQEVIGIFSRCSGGCFEVYDAIGLFDEKVILRTAGDYLRFSAKYFNYFDAAYLNHLAGGKWNFISASFISKRVISLSAPKKILSHFPAKFQFIEPQVGIHDLWQNMHLVEPALVRGGVLPQYAVHNTEFRKTFDKFKGFIQAPFIAVQLSAGNNIIKYKNWPEENWIKWLQLASQNYPGYQFVLLGDKNEIKIAENILKISQPNVLSFVGKTSIFEAMAILEKASCFVGLDGGLMHLSALVHTPTFTLWGPSSQMLYGYRELSSKHQAVSLKVTCSPCNAWINPNHSRVKDPNLCPDIKCMKQLSPEFVFEQFKAFIQAEQIM